MAGSIISLRITTLAQEVRLLPTSSNSDHDGSNGIDDDRQLVAALPSAVLNVIEEDCQIGGHADCHPRRGW